MSDDETHISCDQTKLGEQIEQADAYHDSRHDHRTKEECEYNLSPARRHVSQRQCSKTRKSGREYRCPRADAEGPHGRGEPQSGAEVGRKPLQTEAGRRKLEKLGFRER